MVHTEQVVIIVYVRFVATRAINQICNLFGELILFFIAVHFVKRGFRTIIGKRRVFAIFCGTRFRLEIDTKIRFTATSASVHIAFSPLFDLFLTLIVDHLLLFLGGIAHNWFVIESVCSSVKLQVHKFNFLKLEIEIADPVVVVTHHALLNLQIPIESGINIAEKHWNLEFALINLKLVIN